MTWRVADSLLQLRKQVNEKYPNRKKQNDGTIGDEAHATRSSDHNAWVDNGVVTAMDITHDPPYLDSYVLAEQLRISRDHRIKYIISNGRICSADVAPWTWRRYTGTSPHTAHVHISVEPHKALYDDVSPWEVPMLGKAPSPHPAPAAVAVAPTTLTSLDKEFAALSDWRRAKILARTRELLDLETAAYQAALKDIANRTAQEK